MSPQLRGQLETSLGHQYSIERELGGGGMARVFVATDNALGRRVAIKVLSPDLAAGLSLKRFEREVRLAASLQQANIVPVLSVGEAGGLPLYTMPFVDGLSLRDRLSRHGPLPLTEVIGILRDIARALAYAHERGVVHRDIKPENILLSGGTAVVTDFGVAKAVVAARFQERDDGASAATAVTQSGTVVGTPAYMAPEQIAGDPDTDHRADLYSFGCLAYELIVGNPPFSARPVHALFSAHLGHSPAPLAEKRPECPAFLARMVMRCLEKDPAERPQSAGEILTSLASLTSAAPSDRWLHRLTPRRRVGALAMLILVLGLAVAGWFATQSRGPVINRLAVLPFTNLMNDADQEYFVQGMHDALISELARAGLAVIARTSVMQYRETDKPVRVIARELAVDALVETTLSRTADSVTIEARLISAGTEQYLWSQSYASDLRNVLNINRDVALGIVGIVQPGRVYDAARVSSDLSVDPAAHDAYLKGLFHLRRPSAQDLAAAIQYFELALQVDSNYAPAYAGISMAWGVRRMRGVLPSREATQQALAATAKALELDSTLPEPHFALALNRTWGEWNWAAADAAFRRALELRSNYPEALAYYGHLLAITGRMEQAVVHAERAVALDPFDPLLRMLYGGTLGMSGRFDESIAQYRAMQTILPNHPGSHQLLWATFHRQGKRAEALAESRRWAISEGDTALADAIDRGYAESGYSGAMLSAATTLALRSETGRVLASLVAGWYAAAGENDRALDWLERSVEAREPTMVYLRVHPNWNRLRDHPRFQALVRRMNFPS